MRYPKEETLQHRIYRELISQIACGNMAAGSELPSIRELMKRYQVCRNTAYIALQHLEQEGLIRKRSGRRFKVVGKLLPQVALVTANAVTWDQFRYAYGAWGFEIGQAIYQQLRQQDFLPIFLPMSQTENYLSSLMTATVVFDYGKTLQSADSSTHKPLLRIMYGDKWQHESQLFFDRTYGMEALANYFTVHGVRSLGLLGDFTGTNLGLALDEKFLPSLSQLQPSNVFRISCDITEESGRQAMRTLLEKKISLPIGIFAAGDFAAHGAVEYALKSGLKPKKDFLVTGCTGLSESGAWHPPLSVLTTPFQQIGQETAKVVSQIADGITPPEVITVNSRLIIRGT